MTIEDIKELIMALDASEITTLKYHEGDMRLYLSKASKSCEVAGMPMQEAKQVTAPVNVSGTQKGMKAAMITDSKEKKEESLEGNIVTSPLVGTAYLAPSEDSAPFVKVGDTVAKGQTLAIVEAMKLMNEIESDYDGVVAEVLIENEETVEYGQPLFVIKQGRAN